MDGFKVRIGVKGFVGEKRSFRGLKTIYFSKRGLGAGNK